MKRYLAAAIALVIGCAYSLNSTFAAGPESFALVKTKPNEDSPVVSPNSFVVIAIHGDMPTDPNRVELTLDGLPLAVKPTPDYADHHLAFHLTRTPQDQLQWAQLLGSPFSYARVRQVSVGLADAGRPIAYSKDASRSDEAAAATLILEAYDPVRMVIGLVTAAIVIAVTIALAWRTPLLRDGLLPAIRLEDRPYSLGRFQMAFWFCVILSAFLFILVLVGDTNSIIAESFILLGISGATALGAVIIDQNKGQPVADAAAKVAALGLADLNDVYRLYTVVYTRKQGSLPAATVFPNAAVPGKANASLQELWNAYAAIIRPYKTDGFWRDLVSDINGPTVYRWQILAWTIVIGCTYVVLVYQNLAMPTLGTNLLTLMGISGGVYLGFKIPEKQT